MKEACKFNVQIHNGNILMSSVTKDPGVSSNLVFSGSSINFPRSLYLWPKKFNMCIIGGIVLTAVLVDPRVFGPPGSGSISQRWIRIRIWNLLTLSKNSNITLDFSCFVTFLQYFA
jgi:hypothetical protein